MRFLLTLVVTAGLIGTPCLAEELPDLGNEKTRANYSVGYQIGDDFKRQGVEINPEALVKGIQDAISGRTPLMTAEEQRATLVKLQRQVAARQKQNKPKQAQEYPGESREFLASNANKPGVVTLPSGLQYKVIQEGTGRSPGATDTVTVHYRGTLLDGTEFDSSYSRGKPATFGVGRVIAGWTEALQLMKEGARWQLFIPPDLAYGEKGAGSKIPPNSSLIFDVELISVEPSA
jgi:FKBP-type peptidyl-prolyl cis-trans isomerase FklB